MTKHLKNSLVFFSLAGMQVCWIYAVLKTANSAVYNVLSIPLLLLTLFLSLGAAAWLRQRHWPRAVQAALLWAAWPVVMLLLLKIQLFPHISFTDSAWLASLPRAFSQILYRLEAPLLLAICSALLWWLGRRLAYIKINFSTTLIEFQLGLVMLAVTFFTAYQLNLDQSASAGLAVIFFALALLGIAAAHAHDQSWFFSSQKSSWMAVVLLCIGLILLIGLLAGFIFTPDLIQLFTNILGWIWNIILKILGFLVSLIHFSDSPPPEPVAIPGISPSEDEQLRLFTIPDSLRNILRLAWSAMMIGLFIFAFWKIISHLYHWMLRQTASDKNTIEPLKGAFKEDLLNFLKSILRRLLRLKSADAENAGYRDCAPQVVFTRRLYARFLRWAAAQGYPRAESQTPQEYLDVLIQIKPQSRAGLELITEEYMKVRYGAWVPTDDNISRLNRQWQELKKQGLKKTN